MPHHETERAFPASATAAKPNIECRNIARFFPPSTWALKNATLRIHEGESVAITGASGSGKSTLLSIIGLLDQPSEGELKILGQNMGTASDAERTVARREHIAFVFQAYHLIAHLNATENIAHTLRMRGVNLDTENSHKVLDLLLAGRAEKQSLVIITHEPDIAARCDRQLHMVDGMLVSPELASPEDSAHQALKEPAVRGG